MMRFARPRASSRFRPLLSSRFSQPAAAGAEAEAATRRALRTGRTASARRSTRGPTRSSRRVSRSRAGTSRRARSRAPRVTQGLDSAAQGRSQRARQARRQLRRQGEGVGRRRCPSNIRQDVDKVNGAIKDAQSGGSVVVRGHDGDVHDSTRWDPGPDDVQRPEEARPQGRARVRVQQRELVQEPHVTVGLSSAARVLRVILGQ